MNPFKRSCWAVVLLSAAVWDAGCKSGEQSASASNKSEFSPARTVELYFSTEVSGYIEPCGCTSKPLGGLPRLASVLKNGGPHRGLVDAGNLLFPTKDLNEVTKEQHVYKARLLARAYRSLGAIAINLAESDLEGGVGLLKELQQEGAVPLVSANVRPLPDAGPNVARSFLRTIGDVKLGITGVATPELIAKHKGVTVIEYAPALRAEVKALRKRGAEVVVVLAHTGALGARELAKAVPDIDVIFRAPGTPIEREPSPPSQVGGVIIAEAGSQGQRIGKMTLALGPQPAKHPLFLDNANQRIAKRRNLLERKIKAYRMEADAWSVDPKKAEVVKAKRAQIKSLEAELAQPAPPAKPPERPHVRIELVRLDDSVGEDAQMSALLKGYYAKLQRMNLEKGDPAKCAPKGPTFVGTAKCAECHEEAFAFWKKTKHAVAWKTLEDQNKHYDLTCVGCHTVGYQKPGGFCRIKDVGALKDVGCENCHGAGSVHAEDKDPDSIQLKAPESTCANECHVPEHSDAFVYPKYLREITGPGHELEE